MSSCSCDSCKLEATWPEVFVRLSAMWIQLIRCDPTKIEAEVNLLVASRLAALQAKKHTYEDVPMSGTSVREQVQAQRALWQAEQASATHLAPQDLSPPIVCLALFLEADERRRSWRLVLQRLGVVDRHGHVLPSAGKILTDVLLVGDATEKAELFQVLSDYVQSQKAFLDGLAAWGGAKNNNADPVAPASIALRSSLRNHPEILKLWMRLSPYRPYTSLSLSGWIAHTKKMPADATDQVPGAFFELLFEEPGQNLTTLANRVKGVLQADEEWQRSKNTRRVVKPEHAKMLGNAPRTIALEDWMALQNLITATRPTPGLTAAEATLLKCFLRLAGETDEIPSYQEVATQIGTTANNVKVTMSNIRHKLGT